MAQGFVPKSESEKSKITSKANLTEVGIILLAKQTLLKWVSFFETLEDPREK